MMAGSRRAVPPRIARDLAVVCRTFHARGWALGTSGNFSVVLSRHPLRVAITASGVSKDQLRTADILACADDGRPVRSSRRRPSAETLLHVEVARKRSAGAVLHTHSVWSTILSDRHAEAGGVEISGYEMLKGLQGVSSHVHREWIPILENDQNMVRLAANVASTLDRFPAAHAFLLRKHGMYTWGATLPDARRHVEVLEFLFETVGREEGRHGHRENP